MGFNGARLHQKVFEDRWHYWADRLGYLTWAEFPSWGFNATIPESQRNFLEEWQTVVATLRNHPSIIGWTPLNESTSNAVGTWKNGGISLDPDDSRTPIYKRFMHTVYDLTKAIDPTRPVNDSSGWIHVKTDLWTVHSYLATAKEQKGFLLPKTGDRRIAANSPIGEPPYEGQPFLIDEWGGFKYLLPADRKRSSGWGYNGLNLTEESDFLNCIGSQTKLFAKMKELCGWCFTQLTDVEQEQNGVYTYDRRPKASSQKLAAVFGIRPKWSEW